ncbi:TMV resistance protein N-like isoform X1 [Bidens hawaiensis]|uniref:TMV resistance protein N-like isoform X1 n=1 Tax=Bidens hawaiensis TaxID=980011 RepID=UPI00404A752F
MASSSSCANNKSYKYNVFLSFCGVDTRKTFVDHLYAALDRQGIYTFKDNERLERGKEISEELLQAIEDSRFYIIVFSKRYASSSWCLNELLKIMECRKTGGHIAYPVFYDVDPSDVRKQTRSVGKALAKHKNNNKSEVEKWREALKEAANLSGLDVRNTANGYEAKVIDLIIDWISLELRSIDMNVDEKLIGMEQRVQDLDQYLEIGLEDVRMVGIKGMGGAGKTTLSRAIFDKISTDFEGKSFVENVREKASQLGLEKLQEQILRDVLKNTGISVSGIQVGKNLMKNRLSSKKVIVVLDDVDCKEQLETLAGDPTWFKPGSRVIITTRDGEVLEEHNVKWIHDASLLTDEEAIRLFSRHAFGKEIPTQGYEKHSHEVVRYAAGLPLTIKVLGSKLCGKDERQWRHTLERLKTIPLKETLKKLELSYESLEDEHKELFLNVACFLRGWQKEDAIRMLESCGLYTEYGLRVLEQKSLIVTLKRYKDIIIDMHDHIEEMGKNIAGREHLDKPHKRSRLWVQKEIEDILGDNSVRKRTRCIDLRITPGIFLEGLGNMKKLTCLIVNNRRFKDSSAIDEACLHFPDSLRYLYWFRYPHWCLPKTFEANNLVALEMRRSNIVQLWEGGKVMKKLKFLDLSESKVRSLDLGLTPKLERLNLECCRDLVKVDVDGGCLKSLVYLNLDGCSSLKSVSFIEELESLEVLNISGLGLREFPGCIVTGHSSNSLRVLGLSFNYLISEIPSSIGDLHNLVSLRLIYCSKLKRLPGSICSLQHLTALNLDASGIEELPEELGQLECLEYLHLSYTKVKHLPNSICMLKRLKLPEDVGELESLEVLDLRFCSNLREIPSSICKLKRLRLLNLEECENIEKLPEELGNLGCLQLLNYRDTCITHLPQSIYLLKSLKIFR